MKIYHLKNVEAFIEILDNCKGTVELISKDGDRLNLRSKLCQYVGLTKLFKETQNLDLELELIAHEPEDAARLFQFLMDGH